MHGASPTPIADFIAPTAGSLACRRESHHCPHKKPGYFRTGTYRPGSPKNLPKTKPGHYKVTGPLS